MSLLGQVTSGRFSRDKFRAVLRELYKTVEFEPLPKQEDLLMSTERFNIFVGGVGAGKSLTAAHFAWPRCVIPSVVPEIDKATYWLVAENYQLPRMEFDYIRRAYGRANISCTTSVPRDGSHIMETPFSIIQTKSWSNPDSLHGVPVQGMLVCEAGLLPPDIWYTRLEPRLARVPGYSWCLWSGTLEDSGAFYKDMVRRVILEDDMAEWYGTSMATWENTIMYPSGMEDPEIQRLLLNTPHDIFMERYGAIPKTVSGLVYREFEHTRHIRDFAWNKHRPVYICVDPGSIYALNALQKEGDTVYVIDEIHIEGGSTEDVIVEAAKRDWWPIVQHGIIDATAPDQQYSWTRGAIWEVLKKNPVPFHSKKVHIDSGIEAVRMRLHSPSYDSSKVFPGDIWEFDGRMGVSKLFVHPRCKHLINEMGQNYKYKKLRTGEYSPEVRKLYDHHSNALAYGIVDLIGYVPKAKPKNDITWVDQRPIAAW